MNETNSTKISKQPKFLSGKFNKFFMLNKFIQKMDLGWDMLNDYTSKVTIGLAAKGTETLIEDSTNKTSFLKRLGSFGRKLTFGNNNIPDLTIYNSMYLDFKEGYTLETINESICKTIRKYRIDKNEGNYKIDYNNEVFTIIYSYKFSKDLYATNELLDYDISLDENDEQELLVPAVTGISIYISPEQDENIKKQLITADCFLDEIEKSLLEKHIVKKGKFLYIVVVNVPEIRKLRDMIEKKFKDNDENVEFINSRDDEIKIKSNRLISSRIGEILTIKGN